jgi:glycosyltransferase involved in cell wall biosynthesis
MDRCDHLPEDAMQVLYHLTIPPSPWAALDAMVQEVEALRALSENGGQVLHLCPGRAPGTRFPRRWWGLQHVPYLRRVEGQFDIHHIFNPDPYPLDILRFMRRPVVYTAAAGAQGADRKTVQRLAQRVHTLVVPTEAARAELNEWGISNVVAIRPGIDVTRFSHTPPPLKPLTLLMGSAPWTVEQFKSKGVEALLEAAQARPDLRLIFLWRGLHLQEMERRIAQKGLKDRVTTINRQVDVNEALAQVHAAVVLADDTRLVKAYPHSLLEAMAAGRPVLVSRAIPMADYVERTGCGQVVEAVNFQSLLAALDQLEADYEACRAAALRAGRRDFSQQQMVGAYRQLYVSLSPA